MFFTIAPNLASDNRAMDAAGNLGLTDTRVISKGLAFGTLSGCSGDDNVQFKVEGIAANGDIRTIKVCANVPLGGYTVRN